MPREKKTERGKKYNHSCVYLFDFISIPCYARDERKEKTAKDVRDEKALGYKRKRWWRQQVCSEEKRGSRKGKIDALERMNE